MDKIILFNEKDNYMANSFSNKKKIHGWKRRIKQFEILRTYNVDTYTEVK